MRQKIIDAEDMVGDITSDPFRAGQSELATIVADWSGAADTPTGVLLLQYSPDYISARPTVGNWYNVDGGTFTASPTADASSTCEPFRGLTGWYRLFYDRTSLGDGDSLNAWVEVSDVR